MSLLKRVLQKSLPGGGKTIGTGPIGLDIGTEAIHLCQLQSMQSSHFSVRAKTSIPFTGTRKELLSSPKQLKKLLAQGMKKRGFVGRKVVAVMPPDELKITPVTYKTSARSSDEEILRALSSRVEGDLADYMIDYLSVRSNPGDEESLALAAIARRDDVIDYLQSLSQSGFEVEALDVGPAAIRRLMCTLYTGDDEQGETILVINAGAGKSYLSIISGRRLLFDQPVEFGEELLLSELSRELELPEEVSRDLVFRHGFNKSSNAGDQLGAITGEDISRTLLEILKPAFLKLVEEINRVLIFTASETHGSPISRVCLLGSIARWPGAESLLRDLVDIPMPADQPGFEDLFIDQSEGDDSWSKRIPELAIATGLALRGMT